MHRRMTAVPIFILLIVGMLVAWVAPVAATQEGSAKILRINAGDFFPETFDPQLSDNGQWFYPASISRGSPGSTRNCRSSPGRRSRGRSAPTARRSPSTCARVWSSVTVFPSPPSTSATASSGCAAPALDLRLAIQLFDIVGCEELFTGGDAAGGSGRRRTRRQRRSRLGCAPWTSGPWSSSSSDRQPYFPSLASIWVAFPLRQDLIEAGGPGVVGQSGHPDRQRPFSPRRL